MSGTDRLAREQLAADTLERWPWRLGGALIGGYAVAAYGPPRYSDDLDIVVPVSALSPLRDWLEGEARFVPQRVPEDLAQNYAGRIGRWTKGTLTVDVLPGAVRDRQALIDVPEKWITRDARLLRLTLLHSRLASEVPVVRPEAFWALKLQAGRDQDLSDLFSIRDTDVRLAEVRELFEAFRRDTLVAKLRSVVRKVDVEKLYVDTLSRLEMGPPSRSSNRAEWTRFQRMVQAALPEEARR